MTIMDIEFGSSFATRHSDRQQQDFDHEIDFESLITDADRQQQNSDHESDFESSITGA